MHESVKTVSKDKSWAAIGLYGKKKKTDDKALGYICLFGGKHDWKVDIAGLAEKNTLFFIDRLFSEVKKHVPGGNTLSVEVIIPIVAKHAGLEVSHYDEYFVVGKTKDKDYGWIVDVPLCSE